jgi:hypothetical protein
VKRIARYVAIACACMAGTVAQAADTDPFDFDYSIIGANADRPEAVFNDGSQTFIQPRKGQSIIADGGHVEGPYVVIDGTPDTIQFRVNDRPATAHWKSANSFIGGPSSPSQFRGDQPAGFAGFSDHLVVIGQVTAIEPVRGISSTMTISSLVKALVPQGWSGSAEKDIRDADDSHVQIRFTTKPADGLTFRNLAGESLHPHWDRDTNVVTIDRARVFVVSDGKNKVEIGRQTGMIFDFESNNAAHLEAVFEANGATYFRFAPTVIQETVTDAKGQGKGEQKGAQYKFDGTADHFVAMGDGATTTVSRHTATHFYERTPS